MTKIDTIYEIETDQVLKFFLWHKLNNFILQLYFCVTSVLIPLNKILILRCNLLGYLQKNSKLFNSPPQNSENNLQSVREARASIVCHVRPTFLQHSCGLSGRPDKQPNVGLFEPSKGGERGMGRPHNNPICWSKRKTRWGIWNAINRREHVSQILINFSPTTPYSHPFTSHPFHSTNYVSWLHFSPELLMRMTEILRSQPVGKVMLLFKINDRLAQGSPKRSISTPGGRYNIIKVSIRSRGR